MECFKYLGSQVAADGGCERHVVHRMNEGYRAWRVLKSVLINRGLQIQAKQSLYVGVIVPRALYRAEAWGVWEGKCWEKENECSWDEVFKKFGWVSRMDRVRNEVVTRRAGIERELASRADQKVFCFFGHVERMDEYRMAWRVLMVELSKWRVGTSETEVRLGGWCEGGLRQQRNDGGSCASMHEMYCTSVINQLLYIVFNYFWNSDVNLENVTTCGHAALNMLTFKLFFFTAFNKSQQSKKRKNGAKAKAKKSRETGNSNSSPSKDGRVGGRVG